jgi:hypothetical protein
VLSELLFGILMPQVSVSNDLLYLSVPRILEYGSDQMRMELCVSLHQLIFSKNTSAKDRGLWGTNKICSVSNIESYLFWQTFQLPSSGWVCRGWAFLEALYRADSKWWVGLMVLIGGAEDQAAIHCLRWQMQCLPKCWIIVSIWSSSFLKAEVTHWNLATKT